MSLSTAIPAPRPVGTIVLWAGKNSEEGRVDTLSTTTGSAPSCWKWVGRPKLSRHSKPPSG